MDVIWIVLLVVFWIVTAAMVLGLGRLAAGRGGRP